MTPRQAAVACSYAGAKFRKRSAGAGRAGTGASERSRGDDRQQGTTVSSKRQTADAGLADSRRCGLTADCRLRTDYFFFAASIFFCIFAALDRLAVAGERLLPGGDRVGVAVLLQAQIAEVILDDRILRQLLGRGR